MTALQSTAQQNAPADRPYRDVADAIGCDLVRQAVWSGDRCNWMGWMGRTDAAGGYTTAFGALTPEVYGGVAGIALFLARLQAETGDAHQRRTLLGAVRQVESTIPVQGPVPFGLYSGAVGAGWALVQIGQAMRDDALAARGVDAMARAAWVSPPDGVFDLLNGSAGHVLALLAAGRAYKRDDLLGAALAEAERLITAGRSDDGALSWSSSPDHRDLLGLSHGTAGAALALFEVAAATGRADLREAGRACLRYERRHFDAARQAWPDFRAMPGTAPSEPSFPFAWCHGGLGIGLSRLRIFQLEPDDGMLPGEIDCVTAAIKRRLADGVSPSQDVSLCHGISAIGEFLIELGTRFGRPEALDDARRLGDLTAAHFHEPRGPWPCGVAGAGHSPSLMLGTAGIGLHFLRLDDPGSAPSVLLPTAEDLALPTRADPTDRDPRPGRGDHHG